MSRIAKKPIPLPTGVQIKVEGGHVSIKGPKGELSQSFTGVGVTQESGTLKVAPLSERDDCQAGTARAMLANMIKGVTSGFQRKLDLVGVGYKAQVQGRKLTLSLGYSHPIVIEAPAGITLETPSVTEIVVKGQDRQLVGHIAANIRAYRAPEPYKGKGVKYSDEVIARKEAKKK